MKETIKTFIVFFNIILIFIFLLLGLINQWVISSTQDQLVVNPESLNDFDCILVLGAGVANEKPSLMLEDRLQKGIELYQMGLAKKLIMSGDHSRSDYDEVNVMKNYALQNGAYSEDVFMDHAGFSTYDSIYRAKEIFKVKKMIIVSQKYHLPRALYLASSLGIESIGVPAEDVKYRGEQGREFREFLARAKDFLYAIFKPLPTYLGQEIPVFGNGDLTND